MTKQELMENYTLEQLAEMVIEKDEKHRKTWEMLEIAEKENIKNIKIADELKEKISSLEKELKYKDGTKMFETLMKNTDGEAADLLTQHMYENLKCIRTNARMADDVSITDFFPAEPIKAVDMLIEKFHEPSRASCGAYEEMFKRENKMLYQIAEHLLVYCNANGGNQNEAI